jgi:D-amino peptidase
VKIYISVDIEGVAGVVTPQEGQPGNPEYEQARRLMTLEANAAIAGAFDAGAKEVLVNDSHGPMVNLLPELLDARAELIRGNIKPMSMFAGLDASYAGAMCVGYHAPAADHGVLAHTTNSFAFASIRLNGELASEAMFYGAYAGSLGVPVILLSGDDATERSCGRLFAGARFVRVKTALGQRAARSLAPSVARARIQEAAVEAVRGCASVAPYRVAEPCKVAFELTSPTLADLCGFVPGARRIDARTVGFDCATIVDAIGWMSVCSSLSARLR